ncbi:XRE family transcriptional regulator [Actinoplanes sp. NPDC049681]|uniref:XRE family transcriptional regulator n=1 Tax=Actinoplanes sp. NPDC049681 TaxID=3363905 RepID=UPI0037B74F69
MDEQIPGRDPEADPAPARTLADKLNGLIIEHWRGQKPPGNAVIAQRIRAETGLSISTGYLWMLRTGVRDNPTGSHLQALAKFFGRSPAYFIEADASEPDGQLAAALRSSDVVRIALRSDGLSEQSKKVILSMIEHARMIEKLDAEPPD